MRSDWLISERRRKGFVATFAAITFLLLMAPTAAALEQASGVMTISGAIAFSNTAALASDEILALVAPSLVRDASVTLTAAAVDLCHVTKTFYMADVRGDPIQLENGLGKTEECANLRNVVLNAAVSVFSDPAGYVGFFPEEMSGAAASPTATVLEPRLTTHLASREAAGGPRESTPSGSVMYSHEISEPNVLITMVGDLSGSFSGQLKVRGMRLHVASDGADSTYETGTQEPDGPVGERKVSFVFLTVKDARYTFTSPAPFLLAARAAEVEVDGAAVFTALGGSVVSDEARYEPRPGARERIEGTLTATLTPSDDQPAGTLSFEGTLAATTLSRTPVARPPVQAGLPAWSALVLPLMGTVLFGGGGVLLYTNRARLYLRFAHREMKAANLAKAAEWAERACGADPTDHDSAMWAALLHRRLGDAPRARVMMERASHIAPAREGRPDYYLAVLSLEAGQAGDLEPEMGCQLAVIHLEQALSRAPSLVHEIRRDPALGILRGPEFDAMLREALRRTELVPIS